MVHCTGSGGHFRQPINAEYKYFWSACSLHTDPGSALARCACHKPKAVPYFFQAYCKKHHVIWEVFCSPVLSRLWLFLSSWLKALQTQSHIKLPQLICCTMMARQSFKYASFWREIKCYLWEICLLLALDIAFGLLPVTLLNYRRFVAGFSLCPVFMAVVGQTPGFSVSAAPATIREICKH